MTGQLIQTFEGAFAGFAMKEIVTQRSFVIGAMRFGSMQELAAQDTFCNEHASRSRDTSETNACPRIRSTGRDKSRSWNLPTIREIVLKGAVVARRTQD